jgi:hypothetical protein
MKIFLSILGEINVAEKILTKIKWNFPSNNGGSVDGLNDSGVETFNGNIYESLAREIIQNSIDAQQDKTQPVKVVFDLRYINQSLFPGLDKYKNVLESCRSYWNSNSKAEKHFRNAHYILNQELIPVLKISDYNTTGLTGSEKEDNDSNWFGLIKSTGNSNKPGGSGGSFGIGKNAPFACSDLRTVFYSTLDKNSIVAFQGVGKLVTHLHKGIKTRGTGYFGNSNDNQPIFGEDFYNSDFYDEDLYKREDIGTDIFVPGFKNVNDWHLKMIISVLENFTVALFKGQLEVEVKGVSLKKENLETMIKKYTSKMKKPLAYLYYRAVSEGEFFPKKGYEYGPMYDGLELFLLEDKDLPKQIGMFRKMGMRIFDKKHFRGATNFIGVLVVSGDETNKILSTMEPAAHDKWEPTRASDILDNPEKYLKGINDWMRKCVGSLVDYSQNEEVDFLGAGDYLPMENDDPIGGISEKKEIFPKESKDKKLKIMKTTATSKKTSTDNTENESTTGKENGSGREDGSPGGGEDNKNSNKGDDRHRRNGGKEDSDFDRNEIISNKRIDLKIRRAFGIDKENYKILFTSNVSKVGFLVLDIVGETSKEKYKIKSAYNSSGESIKIIDGEFIGPINFTKNKDDYFRVQFERPVRVALDIYALEGGISKK